MLCKKNGYKYCSYRNLDQMFWYSMYQFVIYICQQCENGCRLAVTAIGEGIMLAWHQKTLGIVPFRYYNYTVHSRIQRKSIVLILIYKLLSYSVHTMLNVIHLHKRCLFVILLCLTSDSFTCQVANRSICSSLFLNP